MSRKFRGFTIQDQGSRIALFDRNNKKIGLYDRYTHALHAIERRWRIDASFDCIR